MMRRAPTWITTLFVSLLFWLPNLNAENLVVGIGADQAAPLVIKANDQITGGIIIDIINELGRRLNVEMSYLALPKKRQEPALLSGQIHLFALSNPLWFQYSDQYVWSHPVLQDHDLFVLHRDRAFPLQRFSDLKGKRLGTIRGFHYEGLMDFFEEQSIDRDDGTHLEQNLDKLAAGRLDALIGSQLQIEYLLAQRADADQFQVAEMIASSHSRRIAFSPYVTIDISDAYLALQQMRSDGTIDAVLARYR